MKNSRKINQGILQRQLLVFAVSLGVVILLGSTLFCLEAYAAPGVSINFASGDLGEGAFGVLEVLFLLVIVTLAPSILLLMTSFTRIVIVLSFLRNALGTQQAPSNQIVVGLALFLTLFIMMPVFNEINEKAYIPYKNGQLDQTQALKQAVDPMKVFMLRQTQKKDLQLFMSIAKKELPPTAVGQGNEVLKENLGLEVIVPSFITSELKRAFTMGFLIFLPFLIIDIVVSSTLMSMGMVMLPPAMIALPFKIMMFVLVDGWNLLLGTLAQSFR